MFKKFTQGIILTILTTFPVLVYSQVSFTNQGNLLGSTSSGTYQDCAVDMNGDFLDDVVRVANNGIYIDYQLANGTFEQTFFPMTIQNPPDWSICAGDIDKNGYNDLLFGNGQRVSFCMANDDGTAYTEDAHPEYIFSQRSTFADIDNDGNLDAFVNHDVDQSHPYRNDGNGNMVLDQSLIETLPVGGNYAAIWVDYDNDWDIDLYITKCRGGAPYGDDRRTNLLYRNNGDGTFTSVGEEANLADGNQSWTTVFEDFDNDGDFDAFIINHASDDMPNGAANKFMDNNGDGTFTDIIGSTGINPTDLGAWDGDAGDFNNDGFIDIFSQMSSELYLNNGDGTFTAQSLNFNMGGIGDFNDDGFLDVIQDDNLWINQGNENNWIKVGCEGLISNKNGIGARIEIYGDWGMQIREIRAGESFRPMSSLVEHFGIGTATEITQMIIKWPSGFITTIDNPEINETHIILEASCIGEPNIITVNGNTEICEGSTVELIADDGESYTWSTGDTTQSITVGQAGSYSVVIWDTDSCASLSNVVVVTLIEDTPPVITIDGNDVFCEGSEVTLTSTPAEGYLWSNGEETQSIIVTEPGDYTVSIDACDGGQLNSEPVTITMLDAPLLPVIEDVSINEPGTATFTASGENLLWFDELDAIVPVGEGPTFETEYFETEISYWVEANAIYPGDEEIGGKLNNAGGGGISASDGGLIFDAFEHFTLREVTIYVLDQNDSGPGERTINLYDNESNMIETHIEFFDIGTHVVELNFEVPEGNGYFIRCEENNLFRNNGGVNYPYSIGTKGSIITSSFGDPYYYYFYNWKIGTPDLICPSDRVEATATVVGIEELSQIRSFSVYPNPSKTSTNVLFNTIEDLSVLIIIRDILGKTVYLNSNFEALKGENILNIDVTGWSSGIYQLSFEIEKQVEAIKIIIE
jgi:hypothetical protein